VTDYGSHADGKIWLPLARQFISGQCPCGPCRNKGRESVRSSSSKLTTTLKESHRNPISTLVVEGLQSCRMGLYSSSCPDALCSEWRFVFDSHDTFRAPLFDSYEKRRRPSVLRSGVCLMPVPRRQDPLPPLTAASSCTCLANGSSSKRLRIKSDWAPCRRVG
jgi:hypothetical protein